MEYLIPIEECPYLLASRGVVGDRLQWNAVLVNRAPRPSGGSRGTCGLENVLADAAGVNHRAPHLALVGIAEDSRRA